MTHPLDICVKLNVDGIYLGIPGRFYYGASSITTLVDGCMVSRVFVA
jgi:hypothetical protein